jgi:transposase InsO family protein
MFGHSARRLQRARKREGLRRERAALRRDMLAYDLRQRTEAVPAAVRNRRRAYALGAMLLAPAALLLFLGLHTATDVGWDFQDQVQLGRGNGYHPMWVHLLLTVACAISFLIASILTVVRAHIAVSTAKRRLATFQLTHQH